MVFPVNVPNAPGVPSVFRGGYVGQVLSYLTRDALQIFRGASSASIWGIYQGGRQVVRADNVVSFSYRQQWAVSDFPVERGGFESYDKVAIPFDTAFRFTAGGSESNREGLLSSIAAIAGNTQLYTIVTPEAVYRSVNISRYNYQRTATNGLGLMIVDVVALEIRVRASIAGSNTQSPVSASQVNTGTVQTTAPTVTQEARLPPIREQGTTGPF